MTVWVGWFPGCALPYQLEAAAGVAMRQEERHPAQELPELERQHLVQLK